MALVKVRPPVEHDHRCAAEVANQQPPGVAAHADRRKARQFGKGDFHLHVKLAEHVMEAAAQNHGQMGS